jgi:hypothetical protein
VRSPKITSGGDLATPSREPTKRVRLCDPPTSRGGGRVEVVVTASRSRKPHQWRRRRSGQAGPTSVRLGRTGCAPEAYPWPLVRLRRPGGWCCAEFGDLLAVASSKLSELFSKLAAPITLRLAAFEEVYQFCASDVEWNVVNHCCTLGFWHPGAVRVRWLLRPLWLATAAQARTQVVSLP